VFTQFRIQISQHVAVILENLTTVIMAYCNCDIVAVLKLM